jgi:hypothetical protein
MTLERSFHSATPCLFLLVLLFCFSCGPKEAEPEVSVPSTLSEVPAVRLNYRYEPDVPPPTEPAKTNAEERSQGVQADFDQNRPNEVLSKTLAAPNGKRIAALYYRMGDLPSEFRLDMYGDDGKVLNKMTADLMAVHFPDTIRWSPDSENIAFVAMIRGVQTGPELTGTPPALENANSNTDANVDPEANAADSNSSAPAAPTPAAPTGILTFRTEQIYISNADGSTVKPVTQTDGLIYFYYAWAPDSTGLVALASTQREWQFLQFRAETNGEIFVPVGRPRIVEKNGRERRLDDGLTAVHPVWSPDSMKVACAFDTQVRVYDAAGTSPTQAAIPLRNLLLISSQAYDREQQQKLDAANVNDANQPAPAANSNLPASSLPDEKSLVSFNPVVSLAWPEDGILYLQTAFIKRMKKELDSVTSFQRWHRLVFTPQPASNR